MRMTRLMAAAAAAAVVVAVMGVYALGRLVQKRADAPPAAPTVVGVSEFCVGVRHFASNSWRRQQQLAATA